MALPDEEKKIRYPIYRYIYFFRIARFPIIKCKISSQSVRTNEPYVIVTDVLSSYSLLPAPLCPCPSYPARFLFVCRSPPRAPVVSVFFVLVCSLARSFVCSFVPSPTSTLRRTLTAQSVRSRYDRPCAPYDAINE